VLTGPSALLSTVRTPNVVSGSAETEHPGGAFQPGGHLLTLWRGTGNLTATLQLRYHQRRADGRKAASDRGGQQPDPVYGAANPALTYTYSGWLDGDDTNVLSGAPSLSTSAGQQPVGSYDILITQKHVERDQLRSLASPTRR